LDGLSVRFFPFRELTPDAALNHLRATGAEVRKEDLARLSPLCHKHFNMLGRYHFAVPEEVLRGELRPLRDLNDADEGLLIAWRKFSFHCYSAPNHINALYARTALASGVLTR
jgi:hypothetical protein